MPDKPTTVAAYAAGASLAAITLFYVFGPTFFIDGDNGPVNGKKRTIVGLTNPANDCFINSVLQALSGLGDLRLYLIRECHRRRLDGSETYNGLPELKAGEKADRVRELQHGIVTRSLKDMLDALNERPIYKKTITARPFIEALEKAYRTRISRNQQDAQEFLQVVAERLCDEYHAGVRARQRAGITPIAPALVDFATQTDIQKTGSKPIEVTVNAEQEASSESPNSSVELEDGFSFEGQLESQVECQYCRFQYKPSKMSFVSLTLNVPQKSSTTLSNCFDGLLKTEYIEDFKCDKCRVLDAVEKKQADVAKAKSNEERSTLEKQLATLRNILETDPEKEPEGVAMPPSGEAPKRKIAKHMRITLFPKVIAVHLSRSIFDPGSYSMKNAAKVAFPERLRLGGLVEEKWYKLLGIVCHKGNHNSGHYESFRRQHTYPPYATPDTFRVSTSYSGTPSPMPSNQPSPRLSALAGIDELSSTPSTTPKQADIFTPSTSSVSLSTAPSRSSLASQRTTKLDPSNATTPRASLQVDDAVSPRKSTQSDRSGLRSIVSKSSLAGDASKLRRKKKTPERWWRISDDKVKECKTSDVLGMQKEVYLLFYELERSSEA